MIGQAAGLIMKNHMDSHTRQINSLLEQLSTGQKINSAGDNPSGLAQVNKLDAKIRGMNKAYENIQQGISLLDTAESGLNAILEELQDYRETALEASADGISDYSSYTASAGAYQAAIDLAVSTTKFGSTTLLDGSVAGTFNIQAGPDSAASNRIDIANSINTDTSVSGLSLTTYDLSSQVNAQSAVTALDSAIQAVTDQLTVVGSFQQVLASQGDMLTNMTVNFEAARSTLMDVDVAEATAALSTYETLQQASATSMLRISSLQSSLLSLLYG